MVRYKDDVSPIALRPNGTLASQEGSAAVTGVEPGRWHRVEARTAAGEVVARADAYVPGDELVLFGMYPNARGN